MMCPAYLSGSAFNTAIAAYFLSFSNKDTSLIDIPHL